MESGNKCQVPGTREGAMVPGGEAHVELLGVEHVVREAGVQVAVRLLGPQQLLDISSFLHHFLLSKWMA